MAATMATARYAFNAPYASANFPTGIALPMIIVTGFTLWVAHTTQTNWVGQWHNWKAWAWVAPWLVLEAILLALLIGAANTNPHLWGSLTIGAVTFALVGISEEVMFRSVILKQLASRYTLPIAMLGSAVLFSLMHAVNPIGGLSLGESATQLWATFLFGMALAPLAVLGRTIVPLIVMHALWDFLVVAASNVPELAPTLGLVVLADQWLRIGIAIVAWLVVLVRYRGGKL